MSRPAPIWCEGIVLNSHLYITRNRSNKLRLLWHLSLLVLVCLPTELYSEQILLDSKAGGVLRRAIVIPEYQFTVSSVKQRSKAFLQENRQKFRVMVFYIFDSEEHGGRYLSGKGGTDVTYESWFHDYQLYGTEQYPIAEMLVLGDSASARYRNADGKIRRVVLEGEDVYRFRVGQGEFELVSLSFPTIPDVHKDGPHEPINAELSVMTSSTLTENTGLAVLDLLSKRFNKRDMVVSLRNDAWFIEEDEVPIITPFFKLGAPPTKEQYYRSTTLHCSLWGGKASCMTFGGFKLNEDR